MNIKKSIFDLSEKSVLVTGATGYLGKHMCKALGAAGAKVLVNSRQSRIAESFCQELNDEGIKCVAAVFDVSNAAEVEDYFSSYNDVPLHGVVNNAYNGVSGSIETGTDEDYSNSYSNSVIASQRIIRLALPALRQAYKESGDASVINISSMYASVSPKIENYTKKHLANPPFYGAAKAGLEQLTRYAACELGSEGIRFNSIAPGPFPSEAVQTNEPNFIKILAHQVPLKRIGNPNEIGGPVVFLISSSASYITGTCLHVDGGWTAW